MVIIVDEEVPWSIRDYFFIIRFTMGLISQFSNILDEIVVAEGKLMNRGRYRKVRSIGVDVVNDGGRVTGNPGGIRDQLGQTQRPSEMCPFVVGVRGGKVYVEVTEEHNFCGYLKGAKKEGFEII